MKLSGITAVGPVEWRQLLEQLVTAAAVAEEVAVPRVEVAKGRRLTQQGPGFSHGRG